MMISRPEIVVFEDQDERYDILKPELEDELQETGISHTRFPHDKSLDSSDILGSLKKELTDPKPPTLVVLDYDLTETRHVVHRQDVREACNEEDIPLVIYHRPGESLEQTQKFEEYEEDVIKIDPSLGLPEVARQCAIIADGFSSLQIEALEAYKEAEERPQKPSTIIPQLLGAPDSAITKLDQYTWGNPEPLFGGTRDESGKEDIEPMVRRWTTSLGYWIQNELLKFPGVLLNPTAVAAYLDVDHEQFIEDERYLERIDSARYEGPFADLDSWYWLPEIDIIRGEMMGKDGTELPLGPDLFENTELEGIGRSECYDEEEGGHKGARYYGALIEKPVCKEHSESPGGWIPMGAVRTRVSETEYEKIGPWML